MKHMKLLYFMTFYCIFLIGLVSYRIYLDHTPSINSLEVNNILLASKESYQEELKNKQSINQLLTDTISNYIKENEYELKEFLNLNPYKSSVDKDGDGVDDQTDILINALQYVSTKPQYYSKYYFTGYPDDNFGVCTDVIAFALLYSGYDIMELLHQDIIKNNKKVYKLDVIDKKIDFRRVVPLKLYFDRHAISLTTDIHDKNEWQGGDIIVFSKHIGIISNKRNASGYPYIIHLGRVNQEEYEEDFIEKYPNDIVGHYRMS